MGEDRYNYLIDGLAVVHKYTLRNGQVTYQNRLLESESLRKNKAANQIVVSEVGTLATSRDSSKNVLTR